MGHWSDPISRDEREINLLAGAKQCAWLKRRDV